MKRKREYVDQIGTLIIDNDATAMCLKEDYYSGLGSNMHAAYNTQLLVSYGLITCYLVTQSRNDISVFTKILDKHYEMYNEYPKAVCADAGYGSFDNYEYLNNHNIKNYVKYYNWEGNVSGKNPSQYRINENETITCLNGYIGVKTDILDRHPKKSDAIFYKVEGCKNCKFSSYCKRYMKIKDENFKIFEVVIKLQKYVKESEQNLLSIQGIEMRVNRSSQVEGAFGVIKQDFMYSRFRRTLIDKVSSEFMVVCLGYNIRKYFKYLSGKGKFIYWKAPNDLKSETFKKPSAKRLSNKVSKVKKESVNSKSKKEYKYNKKEKGK